MSNSSISIGDPNAIYTLIQLLGEGSYGSVYKGIHYQSDAEVAVKIIPCESSEEIESISSEIEFLKRLSSPYVVAYVDSYLFENELWIIMEYCGGGSMCDIHDVKEGSLEEECLRAVVAYSVLGLEHLHSLLNIHRDVKAGNILLTIDGKAKLADFGVSVQLTNMNQKRRTIIGTPYWMAPEVIQEISYDAKADIWSLGITILEMCEGYPPHFNVHPMRAIFLIPMKPAPTLQEPQAWSTEMSHFLSRCLVKTPDTRASSVELLGHPWITQDVQIARSGEGTDCLRIMVNNMLKEVYSGATVRNYDDVSETTGRLGNEALRNRVKAKLDSTKLSVKQPAVSAAAAGGNNNKSPSRTLLPAVPPIRIPAGRAVSSSPVGQSYLAKISNKTADSEEDISKQLTLSRAIASSDNQYGTLLRVNPTEGDTRNNTLRNFMTKNSMLSATAETGSSPRSGSNNSVRMNLADLLKDEEMEAIPEEINSFKDRKVYHSNNPNEIYSFKQLLGEGSYGLVYKGENNVTSDSVAIKVLPCFNSTDIGSEIEFLRKLDSPFIVTFQQGFVFNRELWIVMEFCAGGSVSDIIRLGKKPLDEFQLVGVAASCVLGLAYLHSLLGIHRDIKAGNILLTREGKAKLADFGVSAQLTNTTKFRNTLIGTPFWMAPEVIQEADYDAKADIWGLGVSILEMCEGEPPYFDLHPMRAVFLIPMKPPPVLKEPSKWSAEMGNFLAKCLVKDPTQRATSQDLLNHEWVKYPSSLIQLNLGLAKLRELVNNNWTAIENYRAQKVLLKKDKLRPDGTVGDFPPRRPSHRDVGASTTPRKSIAPSAPTPALEGDVVYDYDTLNSVATDGTKWKPSGTMDTMDGLVRIDLYDVSLAVQIAPEATLTSPTYKKPTPLSPRKPSSAPGQALKEVLDEMKAVAPEATLTKKQSVENSNSLMAAYQSSLACLQSSYEAARAQIKLTKAETLAARGEGTSEADSILSKSVEGSFRLRSTRTVQQYDPHHSPTAPAFKILKYFRRNWKAQQMSADIAASLQDYHKIQCIEEISYLVKAQMREGLESQCKSDTEELLSLFEKRKAEYDKMS